MKWGLLLSLLLVGLLMVVVIRADDVNDEWRVWLYNTYGQLVLVNQAGEALQSLEVPPFSRVAFADDGRRFALMDDETITLYEGETVFATYTYPALSALFHLGGQRLAFVSRLASAQWQLNLLDVVSGEVIQQKTVDARPMLRHYDDNTLIYTLHPDGFPLNTGYT